MHAVSEDPPSLFKTLFSSCVFLRDRLWIGGPVWKNKLCCRSDITIRDDLYVFAIRVTEKKPLPTCSLGISASRCDRPTPTKCLAVPVTLPLIRSVECCYFLSIESKWQIINDRETVRDCDENQSSVMMMVVVVVMVMAVIV